MSKWGGNDGPPPHTPSSYQTYIVSIKTLSPDRGFEAELLSNVTNTVINITCEIWKRSG